MRVLRFLLKMMLLPVFLLVLLCQWIGTFCTGIVSLILNLLSGLFWIVAILGYLMGVCTGAESLQMLVTAFVIFLVPHLCSWLTGIIAVARCMVGEFILS